MFKGKAELVDPEKNTPVATFTETCQSDGTAKMKHLAGDDSLPFMFYPGRTGWNFST